MARWGPAIERFIVQVEVQPNGCWLWTGFVNPGGYGRMGDLLAHRWSYEHFIGPIPDGDDLDHLCHGADPTCEGRKSCLHRRCVNPTHVEPASRFENLHRSTLTFAGKTHCPQGHPYEGDNLIITAKGRRRCRICLRAMGTAAVRKWRAKQAKRSGESKIRQEGSWADTNLAKTHCPAGHEYTPENTYVGPTGSRSCRECHRLVEAARREARRAAH